MQQHQKSNVGLALTISATFHDHFFCGRVYDLESKTQGRTTQPLQTVGKNSQRAARAATYK